MMTDSLVLLNDEQVMSFVVNGFITVMPDLPATFHADICAGIDALPANPGNGIYEALPALKDVYEHPVVKGALHSLLGPGYAMNGHRHMHVTRPGSIGQSWHQDGTNVRHHQVWTTLAMYYPQDVTVDMGPTIVMPGTHFRNAPTDRLASYGTLKGQKPLIVPAGTVAITHYDLWHAATRNVSDRMRYMLKFVFDRTSAPTKPTWNHDVDAGDTTAKGQFSAMVGACVYNSDYYKEWELRKQMWLWLKGDAAELPAGHFKDMLA